MKNSTKDIVHETNLTKQKMESTDDKLQNDNKNVQKDGFRYDYDDSSNVE